MATEKSFNLSGVKPVVFGVFPEKDYVIITEGVEDKGLSKAGNPKVQIKCRIVKTNGQKYGGRPFWDMITVPPLVTEGTDEELAATKVLVSKLTALGLEGALTLDLDPEKAQRQIRDFILDNLKVDHQLTARLYEEANEEDGNLWIQVRFYHTPVQES